MNLVVRLTVNTGLELRLLLLRLRLTAIDNFKLHFYHLGLFVRLKSSDRLILIRVL